MKKNLAEAAEARKFAEAKLFFSGTKEDMSRHRHQEIERQKENINNEKMKRTRNT